MLEAEYRIHLATVLTDHERQLVDGLRAVFALLPNEVTKIDLQVFPDQDGEGTFSVRAALEGPNLYVLNKSIEGVAELFSVVCTTDGAEPAVPLLDPFETEFDVRRVIFESVVDWIEKSCKQLTACWPDIPVNVVGPEDGFSHSLRP